MALINCPECGNEVSDKAEVCIRCGYPLREVSKVNEEEKLDDGTVFCYEKGIQNFCLRCRCGGTFKYMNTLYKRTDLPNGDIDYTGGASIMCPKCGHSYHTITFNKKYDTGSATEVCCPICKSTQIQMVQRKWTPIMGLLTNKVDRVCMNCKHKF